MIQCYLDESGIHEGADRCLLAGYVGSTEQWHVFEGEWNPCAKPAFHGKRFFAKGTRRRPYEGWTDERARNYLDALIGAIKSSGVVEVGAVVDVPAFLECSRDERKYLTGGLKYSEKKWSPTGKPSSAYYMPFQHVIFEAIDAADKIDSGAKVHFVLDRQNVLSPYAVDLYNHVQANYPKLGSRTGSIGFADDEDETPLQAADMCAHCWYKQSTPAPSEDMRYAWSAMGHSLPLLDKEALRLLLLWRKHQSFEEPDAAT